MVLAFDHAIGVAPARDGRVRALRANTPEGAADCQGTKRGVASVHHRDEEGAFTDTGLRPTVVALRTHAPLRWVLLLYIFF